MEEEGTTEGTGQQLDTREWGEIVSVGAGGARGDAFPAAVPSPAPFKMQPLPFAIAKLESRPPVVNTAFSPPSCSSITAAVLISAVPLRVCLPAFVRA